MSETFCLRPDLAPEGAASNLQFNEHIKYEIAVLICAWVFLIVYIATSRKAIVAALFFRICLFNNQACYCDIMFVFSKFISNI